MVLCERGIRVPAVVVWPGVTKPGSCNDTRIQSTDLYPTILRMLNVERPKNHVIDGVDFAKALHGEAMDRAVSPRGWLYRGYVLFMTFPPMLLLLLGRPVWLVVAYANLTPA